MSMAPLGGILGSAAGASFSQAAGEAERTQKDSLAQQRQVDANQTAELAAGIGQTEQDQESSERDADGRRLWEATANRKKAVKQQVAEDATTRLGKDATGQAGTQLDLTG